MTPGRRGQGLLAGARGDALAVSEAVFLLAPSQDVAPALALVAELASAAGGPEHRLICAATHRRAVARLRRTALGQPSWSDRAAAAADVALTAMSAALARLNRRFGTGHP